MYLTMIGSGWQLLNGEINMKSQAQTLEDKKQRDLFISQEQQIKSLNEKIQLLEVELYLCKEESK